MITGTYKTGSPIIKPSKLKTTGKGGVGKELSDGYACNIAIGCSNGCPFCYVDDILRWHKARLELEENRWGSFCIVRDDLEEKIHKTKWSRWKGKEVMMSSTHDPFLPELKEFTRMILAHALPAGVKFCIQTREVAIASDLDWLAKYPDQVRVQMSVATVSDYLREKIEPNIFPTGFRLKILRKAHDLGLKTGVIIAPIMPSCPARPQVEDDLRRVAAKLSLAKVDHFYGEALHVRGGNLARLNRLLGTKWKKNHIAKFDEQAEIAFENALHRHHLPGTYWREHR